MTFWNTVLAVFIAIVIWDIVTNVVRTMLKKLDDKWEQMDQEEKRRIGFGDSEVSPSKPKSTQMRKIGFGAND